MTHDELVYALRIVMRRRAFRSFVIEFVSGDRVRISHPELVDWNEHSFLCRDHDTGSHLFTAESVCRVIAPSSTNPSAPSAT